MSGYTMTARIEADSPGALFSALRRLAHHVEHEHDLTPLGEVVNTRTVGTRGDWEVVVHHEGGAEDG